MSNREPESYGALLDRGWTWGEVRGAVRRGDLNRVRRGAYVSGAVPPDDISRHLLLVRATAPQLDEGTAVSHLSAALVWGMPLWRIAPDNKVWVTRNRANGNLRGPLHSFHCPLPADEACVIDGVLVTSMARTAVDVARRWGLDAGIVACDWALSAGVPRDELDDVMQRGLRRPGNGRARRAVALASRLAESPAESVSRLRFHQCGIPAPIEQFDVRDATGVLLGRGDFAWPDRGVIGECDGREKYDKPAGQATRVSDVVVAERYRHQSFERLGWKVTRWFVCDLDRPKTFERFLRDSLEAGPGPR